MAAKVKVNSFNIFLLNIRSLRHKFTEFQLLIHEFETKMGRSFDIIALTETWLRVDEAMMFQLEGYSLALQERVNSRGGGVAIYIRQGLISETTEIFSTTHNALKFQIQSLDGCKFSGLLIYKFPKSNKQLFMSELTNNVSTLGSNSIILGDMNIDLLKHDDSSSYLNLLASLGFEPKNLDPTREVANSSTCIDHVFCRSGSTNGISIPEYQIIPVGLSDHHSICFKLKGFGHQIAVGSESSRQFRQVTNWESLNQSLLAENWNDALMGEDVNSVYNRFLQILNTHITNNTNLIRIPKSRQKRNPWASPQLIRLSKQKNDLYLLVKKYNSNEYLKSQYKKVSKKVQEQAIKDKKNYYGGLLDGSVGNPRRYWQVIKGTLGAQKNPIERITVDSITHQVPGNEVKVANFFNDYFIQITRSLAAENSLPITKQPSSTNKHVTTSPTQSPPSNSLFLHPVTSTEILDAIRLMSNKKSVGLDGIKVDIMKNCAYSLLEPLGTIINLSFVTGIFPDGLKTAVVIPIHKAGAREEISNYRPISLLSVISKIIELIVKNRMVAFLDRNQFFSDRQFGFLSGRSTDGALLSHITDVVSHIERGSLSVALYLDIKKAFDTVDHRILLDKLEKCGIRGLSLNWFSTYLRNRYQVVRIGDGVSRPQTVMSGVPQGSTLGPLLFLIYVNDLLQLKITGRVYSFADDTSILFSAKSKTELVNKINFDLKLITSWFWEHKLHPNLNKTKILSFGFQNINLQNTIKLHLNPFCKQTCNCPFLDQVSEIKYLGVTLDERLSWGPHTLNLQKKLRKLNYMMYHANKLVTRKHLLRIYRAMYDPVLKYGIIHWGHAPKKFIAPLKVLQKYCVRIMAGIKRRDHTKKYFKEFEIMNFDQILKLLSVKYGHKHFSSFGLVDAPIPGLRDRGPTLVKPNWRRDSSRAQAAYSIPTTFNSLPIEIRKTTFHTHFQKLVCEYIKSD